MIVSAKLSKEMNSYCIVTAENQSAKSREVKNSKEPYYDEHFTIDAADDARGNYTVKVYDKHLLKDDLIGQYSAPLTDIDDEDEEKNKNSKKGDKKDAKKEEKNDTKEKDKDKKKDEKTEEKTDDKKEKEKKKTEAKKKKEYEVSWYARTPQAIQLTDPKDPSKETALLYVRMRRENKVYGTLNIEVKEAEFKTDDDIHVVARLGAETKTGEAVHGKKGKFQWKNQSFQFLVNDTNNTKDAFVDCYQKGNLVGHTRINIYDATKKVKGKFDVVSENKEGHKEPIGTISFVAQVSK